MAKDAEADKSAEAAPKSKSKLIIIAAIVVLALGGGGGGYFVLFAKPKPHPEPEKKVTSFIDLKDMIIGMQPDTPSQERGKFMKIKIALEVEDAKQVAVIQPLLPRVEDLMQIYLRDLRASDLQGTAGILRLKEELLRRVNLAVTPGRVEAILFKEIVLQ